MFSQVVVEASLCVRVCARARVCVRAYARACVGETVRASLEGGVRRGQTWSKNGIPLLVGVIRE